MGLTTRAVWPGLLEISRPRILSQLLWVVGGAAATAASAQWQIPHQPVPYTLQTLIVLLTGAFLGARNGALSQLLYLAAGALGAPVFSGWSAGIGTLLGPTGGYLVAFPAAAAVVGFLTRRRGRFLSSLGSMAAGLLLIFVCGTLQLYAFFLHDWGVALSSGFLIFSWWDLLKLFAAATTYHELSKRWPRLPS